MRNDVRELQKKVLAMTGRVGRKTRYRLLEMHARLDGLIEDRPPRVEDPSRHRDRSGRAA